jgi:hypothetical protein
MRSLLKHCESLAGSGFQLKQVAREFIKKYHLFLNKTVRTLLGQPDLKVSLWNLHV